jgi:hypothetical protein
MYRSSSIFVFKFDSSLPSSRRLFSSEISRPSAIRLKSHSQRVEKMEILYRRCCVIFTISLSKVKLILASVSARCRLKIHSKRVENFKNHTRNGMESCSSILETVEKLLNHTRNERRNYKITLETSEEVTPTHRCPLPGRSRQPFYFYLFHQVKTQT